MPFLWVRLAVAAIDYGTFYKGGDQRLVANLPAPVAMGGSKVAPSGSVGRKKCSPALKIRLLPSCRPVSIAPLEHEQPLRFRCSATGCENPPGFAAIAGRWPAAGATALTGACLAEDDRLVAEAGTTVSVGEQDDLR